MAVKAEKPTILMDSEMTNLRSESDLDKFLEENDNNMFTLRVRDYLMKMMVQYDMDKKDIIPRSGLATSYAHNIFNGDKGDKAKFGRDKLIMLAIGFPLTLEQTNKLLKFGGHSPLYSKNRRDAIIMFAIGKKYSYMKTNECLDERGEEPLV